MFTYPDQRPVQNQTVYIKRPGWNKWVKAKFRNDQFEFEASGHSVIYRKSELELSPPELRVIYWTDNPAMFLAQ